MNEYVPFAVTILAERFALEGAFRRNSPLFERSSGSRRLSSKKPMKPLNVPMQQSGTPISRENVLVSFCPAADTMVVVILKVPTFSDAPETTPLALSYTRPSGSPVTDIDLGAPAEDVGERLSVNGSPAAAMRLEDVSSAKMTASFTTTILRLFDDEPFLNLTVNVPAFVGVPVHLPDDLLHFRPATLDEVVQPLQSDIAMVYFNPV